MREEIMPNFVQLVAELALEPSQGLPLPHMALMDFFGIKDGQGWHWYIFKADKDCCRPILPQFLISCGALYSEFPKEMPNTFLLSTLWPPNSLTHPVHTSIFVFLSLEKGFVCLFVWLVY